MGAVISWKGAPRRGARAETSAWRRLQSPGLLPWIEAAACEHRADSNHSLIAVLSWMAGQALSVGGRVAERPVALSPASPSERLMDFAWESICNFGSLRERDCFLTWMRDQIANGVAEEIEAPAGFDASERWFRHIPTGSLWRLVPAENPCGPGFWPAHDKAA